MINNNHSLYELIKQKSLEKGRLLKIICDWDECIQPVNPLIWYNLAKEKGWKLDKEPFKEWFSYYWTNAQVEYQESCPLTKHTTIKEVEEIRDDEKQFEELVRKPFFTIMNAPNYYEKAPFLSFARDLIKARDEGLVSELVFITSAQETDDRKSKQCKNIFPQAQMFIQHRQTSRSRWELVKDNHLEFDIFIDDSPPIIKELKKNFSADKLYIMPDYPINEVVEGTCRVLICPAELGVIQEYKSELKQVQLFPKNDNK